ncbi:TIM-barrel domain-containing protein [Fodinicola feengrottensis]|uniref:TIM-barrel domain-containing protein n=1 Tax=Fodinicola feengrottensis TaxID=435914 RepID=UPI0036F43B69
MAWVGDGYQFALDACDTAKKGIEDNSDARGFVWQPVSWAGAQRCGVLWSGDQSGSYDYIRWQIPTYAGATTSGIASLTTPVTSTEFSAAARKRTSGTCSGSRSCRWR